jgi:flagellar protein FlaG
MDTKPVEYSIHSPAVPDQSLDKAQLEERRDIVRAVKAINSTELFGQNNELTFVLDRESRKPVLRIINRETKEVIRQVPPEYALQIAQSLKGG